MAALFKTMYQAKGLTRKEFCEATGISQATLYRMLNGDVHPKSARKAAPVIGIEDWRLLLPEDPR